MDLGGIITGVLAIAGTLLKMWLESRPERQAEKRNAEIEKGREDLEDGNASAVEQRIDGMLRGLPEGDGSSGGKDGQAQGGPARTE